jgi:hypothetical protein
MKIKSIKDIKTKSEARQYAIDWQHFASKTYSISYGEIIEWAEYFRILAEKFNLKTEFKENGII